MKELILAVIAALVLPAAHAQEGKKGMKDMEMKDMEKMHDKGMHEKTEKKTKSKAAAKKAPTAKKDEHGH